MKRIVLVVVCLITSFFINAQVPPACFATITSASASIVSGGGACMTIGDFNSDGIIDIACGATNSIFIYIGKGNGGFAPPQSYTMTGNSNYIITKDFNVDGNADLAVSHDNDGVSILYGSGTGTFTQVFNMFTGFGTYPNGLVSADFNGDGKPDLATSNGSNSTTIFLNNVTSWGFGTQNSNYSSQHYITCADFNGDGKMDLATANYNNNTVVILSGNGTGSFSPTASYSTGTGTMPYAIATGDFNMDGKMDLATANIYSNNVSILINTGSGTFLAPINYTVGIQPQFITIGDFNLDGKVDIATANKVSNDISVLMGTGAGTFASALSYIIGKYPFSISLGDYNADGNIDLAVLDQDIVDILMGSATGTFVCRKINRLGSDQNSITTNDFNGDGKADVAVAKYNTNDLSIFIGSGTGSFTAVGNYSVGSNPTSVTTSDFNGDGIADLATTNSNTGDVSILTGNSSGTSFMTAVNYSVGTMPYSLVTGDFNMDGKMDLATANYVSNDVSILIGTGLGTFLAPINYSVGTAPSCIKTGDFNADGAMDFVVVNFVSNDFSILIGLGNGTFATAISYSIAYVAQPLSVTVNDFNADGILDLGVSYRNNYISISLGTGIGTFMSPNLMYANYDATPIMSADFNGDNRADLVTINRLSNSISVYSSTSTSTLNLVENIYANGLAPMAAVLGDFNGDGKIDIVASNINSNSLITLLSSNPPAISITGTNSLCVGSSTVFTANGANTYTWSTGATSASINITPTISTTYSVIGTNTLGCSNTQTISISVYPTPTISVNSGSICSGSNFSLTPSGGITYIYSSGSATVSPNISSTYTVYGSDALGCYGSAISSITVSPSPTISVNSGSICIGDSFTITPSGAISYTYSSINPIITPSVTNTYTITGEDALGCVSSVVNSITVNSLPTLSITSTNSVCINSSATINALGASTYTWNTGSTTASVNITPTITTTYTVIGTDLNNCSNSQTATVTVDNTCQDVWPGDANSDGIADNLDVLELGLHYTQTGTPRASTSNLWQSYYSSNWSGTITNGKNLNHSNCNGDGIINDNDTLAIFNNYSLTHAFKPAQTSTNTVLTITPDQALVAKGTWGSASINLGDASTAINNLNGVAFTVNYDNTLLETDSVWIEYPTSFINATNQNLKFRKPNFSNGKLYTATTHTINGNVSGFGKIAILHYKINSSLATDNVLNLSIAQANQSNASGAITPLTAGSTTLMAIGASVGLNELTNGNYISLHPNPTNGALIVNSTTELQKIEVMAITGQLLMSEVPSSTSHVLHLDHLANGVYFVNLYQNNRIVKREKIILNK